MNIPSAFGSILRKWRFARNMTQSELAAASKLDRTFISMIERGTRQPTLSSLFAISHSLGVSPSELISQTERKMKARRPRSVVLGRRL